jgi:sigma-B regulation protein RsbU (phosphoserine phosphatase)
MAEKILVVDDEEGIRQDLSFILEDEGYEVTTASSGSEAMSHLEEQSFDIVITDLMMPAPDGMEILRKTKQEHPGTVVVMITGHGSEERAVEAMHLGADDYFPKPFNFDKIEEMLMRLAKAVELERLKVENQEFNRRLERELEVARKIQRVLLPQNIPSFPGIDISAFSQPAKQVGGDYYDLIELADGKMGIAIGDVSGKGMPAALLMANAQASVRSYSESAYSPEEVIKKTNKALCPICQYIEEHRFITLFYGVMDTKSGTLSYTNAGHNYPMVFRENGSIYEQLESTGMPCGIMEDADYHENHIELISGDIMLFYTDGITEAMNSKDLAFGEDRLKEVVLKEFHLDSDSLADKVYNELSQFVGNAPQFDDLTFMIIKMR